MGDAAPSAQMRQISAVQQAQDRVLETPDAGTSDSSRRITSKEGDREFFLDAFGTAASNDSGDRPQLAPNLSRQSLGARLVFPAQSGVKSFAAGGGRLAASSGSEGSLSVRLSLCKKRSLPKVAEEGAGPMTGQWAQATFMQDSRSAAKQAEAELAAQMWCGEKFSAGRMHSMIRCEAELDKVDKNPADKSNFLDDGDDLHRLTDTGKPCCSHPGCTKQVQSKGKCIRHGGVRQCTHEDCTAVARWRGLCAAHGGRHTCSEENCNKLVRSQGKCEEHGGGGKRCSYPDCTSGVQKRGLCTAHGGFSVCKTKGCERRAATKGLCSDHAVVVKCKIEGCEKSGLHRGFCYKHGVESGVIKAARKGNCKVEGCLKIQLRQGYCSRHAKERGITVGRKCKTEGCNKVAQAGGCCATHGGGTRCKIPDCNKSVITKGLCSAHGGRKTCKAEGCEKWGLSAGDIKGYCVEHGGGYRCKHSGCNKSVQYRGLCCMHGGKLKCEADGCNKTVRVKGFCAAHATKKATANQTATTKR